MKKAIFVLVILTAIIFNSCQKISHPLKGCWQNKQDTSEYLYFDKTQMYLFTSTPCNTFFTDTSAIINGEPYHFNVSEFYYTINDENMVLIGNDQYQYIVDNSELTISANSVTYYSKDKDMKKIFKKYLNEEYSD